jgi:hypothetical protein
MKAWILAPSNGRCGSCDTSHEQGDRILQLTIGSVKRRRCVTCAEGFGPAEDQTQSVGTSPQVSTFTRIGEVKAPSRVTLKALQFRRRLAEATE